MLIIFTPPWFSLCGNKNTRAAIRAAVYYTLTLSPNCMNRKLEHLLNYLMTKSLDITSCQDPSQVVYKFTSHLSAKSGCKTTSDLLLHMHRKLKILSNFTSTDNHNTMLIPNKIHGSWNLQSLNLLCFITLSKINVLFRLQRSKMTTLAIMTNTVLSQTFN